MSVYLLCRNSVSGQYVQGQRRIGSRGENGLYRNSENIGMGKEGV